MQSIGLLVDCHDMPARIKRAYKDIRPGTWALLTCLQCRSAGGYLIHIAWQTLEHNQPSDVMAASEVAEYFDLSQ